MEKTTTRASRLPSGARFLQTAACFVIVVAGLKEARTLVLPVLIAAFLTLVCIRPVQRLRSLGLNNGFSIALVVAGVLVFMILVGGILAGSAREFTDSLGQYEERIDELYADVVAGLRSLGIDVSNRQISELVDTRAFLEFLSRTLTDLLSALSNLAVILVITIFMLVEAAGFPTKLRRALGTPDSDLAQYAQVLDKVYGYIAVKSGVCLLTGILVAVWCMIVDVDFPVLWGLVAFLFNFIPQIGSIIAAIPVMLLAVLLHDGPAALLTGVGLLAINVGIGNALEPRLMGRRLGLSTLVVILSLIFWNWVLGPVGMVISLPLTMVVKIMLEHSADFRGAAVLLEPGEPEKTG